MEHDRSIATILFTDIVGSTQRAGELGDVAWRELLEHHNELVRKELNRFRGREIATAGDGFLAVFEGPGTAIQCAWSLREAVRQTGLEVRCGLHMGEVEWTGREDVGGIAVHIGARVLSLASDGEIVVSSTVRDAVLGSGFGFEDLGLRELKGVEGAWRLFVVAEAPQREAHSDRRGTLTARLRDRAGVVLAIVVLLGVAGATAILRQGEGDSSPEVDVVAQAFPGIAVLPFSVSGPDLGMWREGMVDLLTTNLDGAGGLRAIASRTVFARWRDRLGDDASADLLTMLDIAGETGARYGLIGTIVSSGANMRIVAEVYNVESGGSLGQERIEGPPDSIFGMVDGLSIRILDRMRQVEDLEVPNFDLASRTTASLPALRAFLAGEALFRRSAFDASIPHYERAVEADSTFALAWARLSDAHGWMEAGSPEAQEAYGRAEALADRLPPRERDLLEVTLALFVHGDPDATAMARAAVEAYPDQPEAWHNLGEAYFHAPQQSLATREEQDDAFDRAVQLDPLYTPAHIHPIDNAFNHADSVALTERLERFGELAGGSTYDDRYRIAYDLVLGNPEARDSAIAALDTIPSGTLLATAADLSHPRFQVAQGEVIDRLVSRPDAPPQVAILRLFNRLGGGRVRDFLLLLEDPRIDDQIRLNGLLAAYTIGAPISPQLFEREFTFSPSDTVPNARHLGAAVYAIDQKNWRRLAEILEAYQPIPNRMRAEGDSASAEHLDRDIRMVRARRAMVEGRLEEALPTLEAAYREGANPVVLGWIVEIHSRLGRPEDALRYGRMFPASAWLGLPLGELYEEVGDIERALEVYGWVLLGFADADRELQPMVQQAQSAIARLQGLQRG